MCTKKGIIKKTSLAEYSRPRINGINAINIKDGDELLEAKLTNGKNEIVLAKRSGKAIRFNESTVRSMGRTASGVKGVTLENAQDEVIGMICINEEIEETILVVSEKGYGKRSEIDGYRITNRGGKGVKTLSITEKTGDLLAIKSVTPEDDLMIITKKGITIRMELNRVNVTGRATQGVRLISMRDNDSIAAVAKVDHSDEEEEIIEGEEGVEGVEGESTDTNETPTEDANPTTEE